ncbi:glycine betaine/L-proline ABC transporter ATP-binding protein [Thermosyntropha sp.]|uniref:quaternary amine ABC transporter ATP-binding protein n=1 Tax=Thermosyntropha sp. TaxID=2740820 RepID=UPI0025E01136|nr:glycine betaine/L-proline ABC transporter ATP-binding protein [Thermosyntropha sp.]MBO8158636.1 glycine betaine/L-proline ABC transporter ATP-binding protein [Thermosyntropha sp.]
MKKLEVRNVVKIYGSNPDKAIALLQKNPEIGNDEIRKKTKQVVGIRDVSFSVDSGESFVIMGLSGSGKSTLLRCINQLIKPTAGEILLDGEDLTKLNDKQLIEIRRKKMGMVFQRFALLPNRTVLENVAYGLEIQNINRQERAEKAKKALEMVGLKGWEDYYPHNLSGGMQQRVGIARALATDPDLLLMDEPFSALDPLIRHEMQEELLELQKKLHKTIIFVTHDLDEAIKIGDKIALMKDARIVQIGEPEEILLSPANDYVARFVENVDRSKALTASAVMVKPRTVIFPKDGPRTALRSMEKNGISSLFVTDRDGHLLGYIRAEDVAEIANQGDRQLERVIQKDMPVAHPDTLLADLLEVLAYTKVPVAVVDEDNKLVGTLVRGSVIAGLAGKKEESHELYSEDSLS